MWFRRRAAARPDVDNVSAAPTHKQPKTHTNTGFHTEESLLISSSK